MTMLEVVCSAMSDDLVAFGTYSQRTADFLAACVKGRLNIVVSGSTGSGKTTTLNVLSSFIPTDERIVTIEDAAELQLHQDHVLRLESRPANIEGKMLKAMDGAYLLEDRGDGSTEVTYRLAVDISIPMIGMEILRLVSVEQA